jgi:prepilin-type N-terminal cleavage/methylation domain-containing protein
VRRLWSRGEPRARGQGRHKDDGLTAIEVLVVVVVLAIASAIAIPAFVSVTTTPNDIGAQANLETALTGARTYFTANDRSYSGIYGGTAVSSITAIDVGLSFVQTASTKAHVVSVASGGSAGWLVLAAFSPGTKSCWIVVDQKLAQTREIAGNPDKAPGTYYGVFKRVPASGCLAGSELTGTAFSSTGFPRD